MLNTECQCIWLNNSTIFPVAEDLSITDSIPVMLERQLSRFLQVPSNRLPRIQAGDRNSFRYHWTQAEHLLSSQVRIASEQCFYLWSAAVRSVGDTIIQIASRYASSANPNIIASTEQLGGSRIHISLADSNLLPAFSCAILDSLLAIGISPYSLKTQSDYTVWPRKCLIRSANTSQRHTNLL